MVAPAGLRKAIFMLAVLASAMTFTALYAVSMVARGLEADGLSVELLGLNIHIPLSLIPISGILIVVAAAWDYMFRQLMPRGQRLRLTTLVQLSAISLFVFTLALYMPYILTSNWLWSIVSDASNKAPQLRPLALFLLYRVMGFMEMESFWKYLLWLNISAITLLVAVAVTTFAYKKRAGVKRRKY